MSFNKIIIEGRLTQDPQRKSTREGKAFAAFSVACNRDGKNATADFFDVVCFDRQADNAIKYLKKGSRVLVEGRMQSKTQESRNGGRMTTWGVSANSITDLDTRRDSENNSGYIGTGQTVSMPRENRDMHETYDDDLPF